MNIDVHSGEKYGVWQSVGDTTGPGGIIRALRTILMYVEIANTVKKWCLFARVINYTNLMALCVRTLYETFPAIKAFGCCHEVFGTQKLLTQAIAEILGVDDVARRYSGQCPWRQSLKSMVTNVNLPNWGQIEGLPLDAVVETNAAFTFDSVMPVFAGRLSSPVESLVARHAYAQETVLRAGLEKDRSLALSAFLNDPLITIGRTDAEKLLNEMLSATASYLKGW